MKTPNIAQRTDEWFDWRKQGVTGTDAAAILGRHDTKTPWYIWASKLGKVPPEDISGNPNVQRGIRLEPVARQFLEEKHGLMLLPLCGEHDEHPILRVSFDGVDDNGRPVEIKCPADSTFESVKEGGIESKEYKRYVVQVQHQILVAGADSALLVYFRLNPQTGEPETVEFELQKDEALHQEIITASLAFWPLVLNQKEPAKDPLLDIFVPTGAERGEWMTLAGERRKVNTLLTSAEGQVKTLKGDQKKLDDKLILLMGEFLRAECDGVGITRYQQQASVDWKALIADLAPQLALTDDVLDQYRGVTSSRTRITQTDTAEAEEKAAKARKGKKAAKPANDEPAQEEPRSVYAW